MISAMTAPINHVPGMAQHANATIYRFAKDMTGGIPYRFNKQGFRGTDFDFIPRYAFFGASLVFGIGVDESDIFPYLFQKSHNYGLAGDYDNHDTMIILEKFLASSFSTSETQIAVVWHARDAECLDGFYQKLKKHTNVLHLYCGTVLPYTRCYKMPPQLDQDVSQTHMGPKTHRLLYKILCGLFDKL